jgi:ammonia channel protein AmtB
VGLHYAMLKLQLDDPLDAVAVHCGGGSVGIFFVHFFSYGTGIFWKVFRSSFNFVTYLKKIDFITFCLKKCSSNPLKNINPKVTCFAV